MKNIKPQIVLTALALAAAAPFGRTAEVNPPPGFTAIFNGKNLDGWFGFKANADPRKFSAMSDAEKAKYREDSMEDARKHWTVENGELVNDGYGAFLSTEKDYGDIELMIDYKTVPRADSGIYLRANPQVQIWDHTNPAEKKNGADKGSGGLWNNSPGAPGKDPLVLADKPFGEWNHFRIIQIGSRTTVWLNDKLVVDNAVMENYWDRKNPLWKSGPIQLQTHGGEIRWRNIYLREIPPDEANEYLMNHDKQGFVSFFNGKDFEGWGGPTDNYEVKDGAILCQPHKGGTPYNKTDLTDFVARLEFKLPPGGNNGLAIRYPGEGDTAYVGMCEIQVLDDPADQYRRLDPRQYCGSVYGMVAAHRGFLRPVGQWNYYQVTVKGPTIVVELNGTPITKADVSKVTDFMANHPHPGKDRTHGYFGLAGHNDPVAFREIYVKKLD